MGPGARRSYWRNTEYTSESYRARCMYRKSYRVARYLPGFGHRHRGAKTRADSPHKPPIGAGHGSLPLRRTAGARCRAMGLRLIRKRLLLINRSVEANRVCSRARRGRRAPIVAIGRVTPGRIAQIRRYLRAPSTNSRAIAALTTQ